MFCSKCGKEITDESVFCSSCGSKVEINEKSVTIIDPPTSIDNIEKTPELQNSTLETNDEKSDEPKTSTSSDTNESIFKSGYGWVILFILYGYVLSSYFKNNPYPVTAVSMVITFSSFILLLVIYFRQRSYLLKKDFWKKHIDSASLLSGLISCFLVGSLVVGSINYISGNEKRKEVEEFMNNYKGQIEMVMKQEIEYIKIMEFEPQTVSELKDKISKIDEYKNFRVKKNNTFLTLVNYFREINSKYKKDKSVDEQINKLEKILSDVHKTSMDSLDLYKKYLITGDEKYLRLHLQGGEKIHSVGDEITKLTISIGKSL